VAAFANQRANEPTGTKVIGPQAGGRTLYRLGLTNDHRGATWYDDRVKVVWLCAYRLHRSGSADDAFPYFRQLMESRRMLPTSDDYEALAIDRGRRFVDTLQVDAQELLARARSTPGFEQQGVLGGAEPAAVVVEVVDTLHETYVALSLTGGMTQERLIAILRAFYPECRFSDWDLTDRLPTRPVRSSEEICYRILKIEG
jgi:hypothetical protein